MPGRIRWADVRTGVPVLAIACVALGTRVAVVTMSRAAGVYSDMVEYQQRAMLLLEHGPIQGMYTFDAWRSPGYPLFLWATYSLAGVDFHVARLAQSVLGALITVLTYAMARQVVGRGPALAAAAVVAVYPAFSLFALYLASETLFTFLMLLGLWLWTRGGRPSAIACGLVFGVATLTRAAGLAALPGVVAAAMAAPRVPGARVATRLGLVLAAYILVFVPWVARNAQIYDRFIPIDTNGGFNVLVGNNPGATGRFEWEDQDRLRRDYYPDARTDAEISETGLREGLAYIKANPRRTASLAFAKLGYLAGLEGREHVWLYSVRYFGILPPATIWGWGVALIASFPLVMAPAVFGLLKPGVLSTPVGAASVTILAVSAMLHVASFGEARYHLPLVPFLAILAARTAGAPALPFPAWSRWRQAAVATVLLGLAWAWQSQWPLLVERLTLMATATGTPPALVY